jgi:Asp-tRNA(Asn)/Glu-tRNA(Gln) amidotransferase A subunit family amidase
VVNLTEDLALQQAAAADREMARGSFRGPLHGIPWGAKDLISVPGYPTTWGVPLFAERELNESATVYQKLTEAGAVLVAKLSLGALAMGDRWHGGLTRNPWNPEQGSSGSSAGSASAVAAGLVGFAIGSETLGSILSPCRVCGTTGLRPTFGIVSRAGCMPLSWTMDKLGPMTRTAEDAALVLQAIVGADDGDLASVPTRFQYPFHFEPQRLRVGFVRNRRREGQEGDPSERRDLQPFEALGCQLIEVELPDSIPARTLTTILEVEGASVFESWLNQGQIEGWNAWPGIFRSAQFITAVDYLRAQRLRGVLIQQMEALFDQVDVLVNANDLVITNLTGHPSLSFTDRLAERGERMMPQPCVLTGRWHEDGLLATLAWHIQRAAGTWQQRPPLEADLQSLATKSNE